MSSSFETKESLLAEFQILWDDAEAIWNANLMESDFQGYVSSDFPGVFEELYKLRGRIHTVLEWGSGLGVIAMMAARIEPMELDVQQVGEGRQRVPVGPVARRQRPAQAVRSESLADLRILADVLGVVVADELEAQRRGIDDPRRRSDEHQKRESERAASGHRESLASEVAVLTSQETAARCAGPSTSSPDRLESGS